MSDRIPDYVPAPLVPSEYRLVFPLNADPSVSEPIRVPRHGPAFALSAEDEKYAWHLAFHAKAGGAERCAILQEVE